MTYRYDPLLYGSVTVDNSRESGIISVLTIGDTHGFDLSADASQPTTPMDLVVVYPMYNSRQVSLIWSADLRLSYAWQSKEFVFVCSMFDSQQLPWIRSSSILCIKADKFIDLISVCPMDDNLQLSRMWSSSSLCMKTESYYGSGLRLCNLWQTTCNSHGSIIRLSYIG